MSRRRRRARADAFGEAVAHLGVRLVGAAVGLAAPRLGPWAPMAAALSEAIRDVWPPLPAPAPPREPRLRGDSRSPKRGAGPRAGKARGGAPRGPGRKPPRGDVLEARKIRGVWHVV